MATTTTSYADTVIAPSVVPNQRPLKSPPSRHTIAGEASLAIIEGEAEHNRRQAWSSALASVIFHVTLISILALFCLPAPWRDNSEIIVGIADASSDVVLDELTFEAPSLELSTASQPEEPQVDPLHEVALADLPLASLDRHASNFALELANMGDTNAKSSAPSASRSRSTKPHHSYRTSFFGIPANGKQFVYVLDMSTSMKERTRYGHTRFQVAAAELLRSVEALHDEQEFLVVLFCYRTLFFSEEHASSPKLLKATRRNKAKLRAWLAQVRLASGTDPRLGVLTGLRLQPDAVFLLSDGEFNGQRKNIHGIPGNARIEFLIAGNRQRSTPIHTIAFEDEENRARLAGIAQATGGQHRFVGQ